MEAGEAQRHGHVLGTAGRRALGHYNRCQLAELHAAKPYRMGVRRCSR